MRLSYLAFRNMVSKPLNLILSLLLLVLSVSLVTFVLQLSKQLDGQLKKNIGPFDMVVGAKGSPLQLVLSSVLHIDAPTGNILLKDAELLQKNPLIATAIPVSYGDNFKGYRILGTQADYLDQYNASLQEGNLFKNSFDVVVGSAVSKKLGLKLGDTFVGSHGLAAGGGDAHDDHPYTVTGLLNPTGTVVDHLLITNLESVWEAHDHGHDEDEEHDLTEHDEENDHHEGDEHENGEHEDHDHDEEHDHHEGDEHEHGEHEDHDHDEEHDHHEGDEHEHDEDLEITSLLIKFKNPLGMVQMPRYINENTNMQASLPGFEIQRLMGLLGSGVQTINGIAFAILLVSGLSIFISLLKAIRERRQELALLRTYGLKTRQLLWVVFLEGFFLTVIGFVLGWLIGRFGIIVASQYTEASYGYSLQVSTPDQTELILLAATMMITLLATMLASISIFKLNISKILSDA